MLLEELSFVNTTQMQHLKTCLAFWRLEANSEPDLSLPKSASNLQCLMFKSCNNFSHPTSVGFFGVVDADWLASHHSWVLCRPVALSVLFDKEYPGEFGGIWYLTSLPTSCYKEPCPTHWLEYWKLRSKVQGSLYCSARNSSHLSEIAQPWWNS